MLKEFRTFARPIILSAFSFIFISFTLNEIITLIDPSYHLLSNRGIGKIIFTLIAIAHVFILLFLTSKKCVQKFLTSSLYFFTQERWIKPFFSYFISFFIIHIIMLLFIATAGYATITPLPMSLIVNKWKTLSLGFIATFFLAWTEEMIFRGALFIYLRIFFNEILAAFITSIIFSLAHNLYNPLILISQEWQLGLGLFLLGFFLNLIFIQSNKLYTGMGIHAGLVFVKVILRRLPFITFLAAHKLPWFISSDLRKSIITHLLLLIGIVFLLYLHKKKRRISQL